VTNDQAVQDIRALFDWRNAPVGSGTPTRGTASAAVGNSDLELALELLSCNSRDREQFELGRSAASPN